MCVQCLIGDNVKVSWSNSDGGHTGFLPIEWLKEFDYSMMIKHRDESPPLVAVSGVCVCVCVCMFLSSKNRNFQDHIPRVSYSEAMSSDEGLWK